MLPRRTLWCSVAKPPRNDLWRCPCCRSPTREEEPTPPHSRRPGPRKKLGVRQRLAQGLINAKRSGELHSLVETFVNTQTEMVSEASDLQALKEKMKDIMLGAHRRGELHCIAGELAREVQRKATDFERLKDR